MAPLVARTRPSGQPLAAPSARLDPNAFGAGVSVALGNMAQATDKYAESQLNIQDAKDELALAHRDKETKTRNFKALRGLSEFGVAAQQRMTALTTEVGPDADGYTNLVRKELEQRQKEWLGTLPPDVLEEMDYRSGLLIDDLTSGAYKHEYATGRDFVGQQIDISQNQALTKIYDNPDFADEETIRVLEEISAAPYLTQLEKEAAALQFRAAAEAAEAGKRIEIYALSQGTIGEADGSDIVAAGLPVVARGLLNAIASVEARGYNILNGDTEFEGYADHPGVKGKASTAAGRYQFVKGTWAEVASDINAPDFSPEWQDRGAWHYANKRYEQATGKDLYTVLMSGDREQIKAVRKVLAGTGSGKDAVGVVWEGLQNMTDDAFANYVMGSHGQRGGDPEGDVTYPEGPSLFDDPRYANIDFATKIALAEDAERRAAATRTATEAEETKRYQSWLTEREFTTDAGGYVRADIEADLKLGKFKQLADAERLRNIYDNRNKGIADANYYANILADPAGVVARNDERAMRGANKVVELDNGLGRLQNQDQEYVTQGVVPLVQRAKDIPTTVIGTLEAMARSNNPNQIKFAYESLRQLEAAAPDAFRLRMPEDAEKDYRLYMGMRDSYPADEVINRIKNVREFRQEYPALMEEVDRTLKGDEFNKILGRVVDNISTEFLSDPDLPLVPTSRSAFQSEFEALYRDGYARSGNAEVAEEFATEMMKRSWAPFEFGNRYALMKDAPPTKGYQMVDQSYNWMQTQIEAEYPELAEAGWYQLIPDGQTRNEYERLRTGKRANLPSYLVYRADENGVIGTVLGDDNQPVRWRGDPSSYQEEFRNRAVNEDVQVRYNQLEAKKALQGGELSPEEEAQRERLADEVRALPSSGTGVLDAVTGTGKLLGGMD